MRTLTRSTLVFALIVTSTTAGADEEFDPAARAKTIAPFIDELTVAVAHVDLSRIPVDGLFAKAAELVPDARQEIEASRAAAHALLAGFALAGGNDVYVVLSLADVPDKPGFLVVPLRKDASEKTLTTLLGRPHFEATGRLGDALVAGRGDIVARLKEIQVDERPELAAAFEAAGDTAAQLLILPPKHTRRVVEEMMPTLPEKAGGGSSTVITRGLLWAALGVNGPPDMSLQVVIQSQDNQAAAALRDKWDPWVSLLGREKEVRKVVPHFDELARLLTPQVQGDRLTLTLNEQNQGFTALLDALKPTIETARRGVMRSQSANNLKQIGLAMHNYHDAHKSFPAAASYDADGKPLLSWRVHILPLLEQNRLYEQFHLDEPWDSDHNRKLIERMPTVYRCPASKLKEKGRTSYLVPVGEGTVFSGRQGVKLKDIKDGTSHTIMVVEVGDEQAVIWTKPQDLPFDPDTPAKGLAGPYEGGFWAAFCDGSARFVDLPQDPKNLRALFTRDAGD